jgi:hypothetical protein
LLFLEARDFRFFEDSFLWGCAFGAVSEREGDADEVSAGGVAEAFPSTLKHARVKNRKNGIKPLLDISGTSLFPL